MSVISSPTIQDRETYHRDIHTRNNNQIQSRPMMRTTRCAPQRQLLVMHNTLSHLSNPSIPIHNIKERKHFPMLLHRQRHPLILIRLRLIRDAIPEREVQVDTIPPYRRRRLRDRRLTDPTPRKSDDPTERAGERLGMDIEERQTGRVAELPTRPIPVLAARRGEVGLAVVGRDSVRGLGLDVAAWLEEQRGPCVCDVFLAEGDVTVWRSQGVARAGCLCSDRAV